ncbi:MAG: outer membrane beta-barrel protein [Bacteroidales bacterium]|nr:outer membrane beta-barrel protein [Bacteroidales bacterium]
MKKGIIILFIFFISWPINLFAQRGYISTDSSIFSGIKLMNRGAVSNAKFCHKVEGNKIIKYSPYDLKEYGFNNYKIFVSRDIQIQGSIKRVFLECITEGNIDLYYYRGRGIRTFYIENDTSPLIEITKKESIEGYNNFKTVLEEYTSNCEAAIKNINYLKYNRISFKRFIKSYNKCEYKSPSYFKYGFITGFGIAKLNPSPIKETYYVNHFDFKHDKNFTLGIFIDNPILAFNFSFHSEILYSSNGYSYSYSDKNTDIDIVINTRSIKLPFLLKYTIPYTKFLPFVNLGGIYSYQLENENMIYKSQKSTIDKYQLDKLSVIEIVKVNETSLVADHELGFCVGGGMGFKLNNSNSVFLELRYNYRYGLNKEAFGKSELDFLIGISL